MTKEREPIRLRLNVSEFISGLVLLKIVRKVLSRLRVLDILCATVVILLVQAGPVLATSDAIITSQDQPVSKSCDAMNVPLFRLISERSVGRFIKGEIVASYQTNGSVDWECIVRNFESFAENTSVIVYEGGGTDGADVYRFTVDKTSGFFGFFRRNFSGPGGPGGIYTAVVLRADDGEIAIVQTEGMPTWLRLE